MSFSSSVKTMSTSDVKDWLSQLLVAVYQLQTKLTRRITSPVSLKLTKKDNSGSSRSKLSQTPAAQSTHSSLFSAKLAASTPQPTSQSKRDLPPPRQPPLIRSKTDPMSSLEPSGPSHNPFAR